MDMIRFVNLSFYYSTTFKTNACSSIQVQISNLMLIFIFEKTYLRHKLSLSQTDSQIFESNSFLFFQNLF